MTFTDWLWRIPVAILMFVVIMRVGMKMLRSASQGPPSKGEREEPEDVEGLDVYFVCKECGTEFKVTQLGELQVPRHCGEKMDVVRHTPDSL